MDLQNLPVHTSYNYSHQAALVCSQCKIVIIEAMPVGYHYFRITTGRGRTAVNWDYLIIPALQNVIIHGINFPHGINVPHIRPVNCQECFHQIGVSLTFAAGIFVIPKSCVQICKYGPQGVPNEYVDVPTAA